MIYIYRDYGTQEQLMHVLKLAEFTDQEAKCIGAKEVIHGNWDQDAKLFILPGGFDLGYKQKLSGAGNARIKQYVENGGSFLGICAGSYYACSEVIFDEGKEDAIVEKREMCFSKSSAIGPLVEYNADTYEGARVLKINVKNFGLVDLFYNGGPYFLNENKENIIGVLDESSVDSIEIKGTENEYPVILNFDYGKGRVVLSSMHFEFDYKICTEFAQFPCLEKFIDSLIKGDEKRIEFAKHILRLLKINIVT